jgi:hypothetical protein
LACHAYSVFKVRVPDSPGQKRKGPGVARPLVDSLFNRGSSSCSHRGDSGPGDARLGFCQRTHVLAGYRLGRRRQPASRLRVPRSSTGHLCLSWQVDHTQPHDDVSRCQIVGSTS